MKFTLSALSLLCLHIMMLHSYDLTSSVCFHAYTKINQIKPHLFSLHFFFLFLIFHHYIYQMQVIELNLAVILYHYSKPNFPYFFRSVLRPLQITMYTCFLHQHNVTQRHHNFRIALVLRRVINGDKLPDSCSWK